MSITVDHPNEQLIPVGGTLTINGNEAITGLTASKGVETNASKLLVSTYSSVDMFEAALVY